MTPKICANRCGAFAYGGSRYCVNCRGAHVTKPSSPNAPAVLGDAAAWPCALLLAGCTGQAQEWDHIIPRAAGGGNELDNYQPVCRHCNQRKGGRAVGPAGKKRAGVPPKYNL